MKNRNDRPNNLYKVELVIDSEDYLYNSARDLIQKVYSGDHIQHSTRFHLPLDFNLKSLLFMKIILLFICITIFSNIAFSQMSAIFSIEEIGKDIDCDIYFYQSCEYEVILREYLTDDMPLSILLSYGNYKIRNGDIELIDKYNGHKMLFTRNKVSNITAKIFYPGMLNKKFVKSTFGIYEKPLFTKMKIMPLNQERLNHKLKEKEENSLSYGTFKSEWGLSLDIQSNSKYILEYKKIILSKGTWSKEGNELRLQDSVLKHSFYIMIDKNVLQSKFLPEENTISNFSNLFPPSNSSKGE